MVVLLAVGLASPSFGQQAKPPADGGQAIFKPEELDALLAPIALYPDDLLAMVLVASTYPIEVVEAERWSKDPKNAKFKGDQLAKALESQEWDPSVKSLVPFPDVLDLMSQQLAWTQKLGDAFLAQQQDVMASVQRLRKKSQEAGSLQTNEQQKVTTEATTASDGTTQQTIIIEPANPQVVYVPSYSPAVVYGGWPYPAYPPAYFPPPPGYAFGSGALLGFGVGIAVGGALWGWGNCNWGGGDINVNANKYNNINVNKPKVSGDRWQHDPSHRKGVAYRDQGSKQKFGQSRPGAADRQQYRGRDGDRQAGQSRPGSPQVGDRSRAQAGDRSRAQTGDRGGARPSAQRQQRGAFEGMQSGSRTRAELARGQSSRSAASRGGGGARSGGGGGGGGGRAGGGGGRGGGGRR